MLMETDLNTFTDDALDIYIITENMREYQKEWFANKEPHILSLSKKYEGMVDEAIAYRHERRAGNTGKQEALFLSTSS